MPAVRSCGAWSRLVAGGVAQSVAHRPRVPPQEEAEGLIVEFPANLLLAEDGTPKAGVLDLGHDHYARGYPGTATSPAPSWGSTCSTARA